MTADPEPQERQATTFRVLLFDRTSGAFLPVGEAEGTWEGAVKALAGETSGLYVAVPVRNWHEVKHGMEQPPPKPVTETVVSDAITQAFVRGQGTQAPSAERSVPAGRGATTPHGDTL